MTEQAEVQAKIHDKIIEREKRKRGRVVDFLKQENPSFLSACAKVSLPPTKRQASKWLNHKGKAWKQGR